MPKTSNVTYLEDKNPQKYLKREMLFIQVRPSTRQETERPNGYLHRVRQLRDIEDRRPGFHGGNQRIPHRQMERQSGDNQ